MDRMVELSLKRGGRTLTGMLLAAALWTIALYLTNLPLPEWLMPVVGAIINAIGKYIRETLKLRVPF